MVSIFAMILSFAFTTKEYHNWLNGGCVGKTQTPTDTQMRDMCCEYCCLFCLEQWRHGSAMALPGWSNVHLMIAVAAAALLFGDKRWNLQSKTKAVNINEFEWQLVGVKHGFNDDVQVLYAYELFDTVSSGNLWPGHDYAATNVCSFAYTDTLHLERGTDSCWCCNNLIRLYLTSAGTLFTHRMRHERRAQQHRHQRHSVLLITKPSNFSHCILSHLEKKTTYAHDARVPFINWTGNYLLHFFFS